MYTTSDLIEICSLYFTQAAMLHYLTHNREKQRVAAIRCLHWKIAADMIYRGEY